jgi:phospholipid transport system substrate-binding protein
MCRVIFVLLSIIAVVAHAAPEHDVAAPGPESVARSTVTRLQDGIIALMQSGENAPERTTRVTELLRATHDLPYIARVVLGRHWRELGAEDQAKFIEQFEALSVANYMARFRRYGGERFEVADEQSVSDDEHNVGSTLTTASGEAHEFVYTLHRTGDDWRIVNIVVDGVSDLALKRAEYGRLMDAGGFAALLAELTHQTERLHARAQETT